MASFNLEEMQSSLLNIGLSIDDINKKNDKGKTALIENITSIESVKILVEKGANVDLEDDDGMTPLMHAVRNKQDEVVEYLLTKKADVNKPDKMGRHALAHCFMTGPSNKKCGTPIIKAGADLLLMWQTGMGNQTYYEALTHFKIYTTDEIALLNPSFVPPVENILLAIKRGASVSEIEAIANTLESRTTAPEREYQDRPTNILSFAARHQRLDLIQALLALGFKDEEPSDKGHPGYGVAIQSAFSESSVTQFVKDLLKLGLRPDEIAYSFFYGIGGNKQDLVNAVKEVDPTYDGTKYL